MHADIEKYLNYLKAKTLKPLTLRNQQTILTIFFDFLGNKNVKDMTKEDVANYLIDQWNKKRKQRTIEQHKVYLRQFFNFHGRTDIASSIERKKVIYERRPIPSQTSIVEKIGNIDNVLAKAVSMFLYGTGVRREELIKLQRENLKFSPDNYVIVGSRMTIFPLGVQKFLREVYWDQYYKNSKFVFADKEGRPLPWTKINNMLKKYGMNPDLLRKAFANHLSNNGVPLLKIMEFLGLRDINSIEIYIQPKDYSIDDALSKHPYHDALMIEKFEAIEKVGGLLNEKMATLDTVLSGVLSKRGEVPIGILGIKLSHLSKIKVNDRKKHSEILKKFNFLNDVWVTLKHHPGQITYGDEIKILTEKGDMVLITSKVEKFDTVNFENRIRDDYSKIYDYLSSLEV